MRTEHRLGIGLAALAVCGAPVAAWQWAFGAQSDPAVHDRGDNGVWTGGHGLHGDAATSPERLAMSLHALGVKRLYPDLGPVDARGWPGRRLPDGAHRPYTPESAGALLTGLRTASPEVAVLPRTGGLVGRDLRPGDADQRAGLAAHAALLTDLGAAGLHLDATGVADGSRAWLALLDEVKAAMPPDRTLSVTLTRPPVPGLDPAGTGWSLGYVQQVCAAADAVVLPVAETGASWSVTYETRVAWWTRRMAERLPGPDAGGCTWTVAVSTDDTRSDARDPTVESVGHAVAGVRRGLAGRAIPTNFVGVDVMEARTASAREWASYEAGWRGRPATGVVVPERADGS